VREIGRHNYGFAFAHSVRVDAQDNIWAVDEGTDMLIKFNPAGQVPHDDRPQGRSRRDAVEHAWRRRISRAQREVPVRPGNDVAFDQQGNIFVSDGYFDARVVKYDKNGRFVKAVGTRGNATCSSTRRIRSPRTSRATCTVGDRGNARVQVLTNDLEWKANYSTVGIRGLCACQAVLGRRTPASSTCSCRTRGPTARPPAAAEFTGEVYKMELDGTDRR
jgi:hypothetical protein